MTGEEALFRRMESGDNDALQELIAMYYPEILRYCMWNAPDRHMAEDAAQETFLKAIRYFDRYVHKGRFRAFLYQVAANTCIDMKRKRYLTDVGYEQLTQEPEYEERGFQTVDGSLQLRQMVAALPAEWQDIVILRYGQELSMREIAQIVRLPLRTVQSRLRLALKKLRKEMKDASANGES